MVSFVKIHTISVVTVVVKKNFTVLKITQILEASRKLQNNHLNIIYTVYSTINLYSVTFTSLTLPINIFYWNKTWFLTRNRQNSWSLQTITSRQTRSVYFYRHLNHGLRIRLFQVDCSSTKRAFAASSQSQGKRYIITSAAVRNCLYERKQLVFIDANKRLRLNFEGFNKQLCKFIHS